MEHEHQVPIWFFVGCLLLIYGILILGYGLYCLAVPTPLEARVALYEYHADLWWGVLMTIIGLAYTIRFNPLSHHQKLTGEADPD